MIIDSQQKLVLIKTLFIIKGFVLFLSKGKNKDVSFEKRKEKKKKKKRRKTMTIAYVRDGVNHPSNVFDND